MPHIHTDPGQHDATASALIIRTDGPEPQVLFHIHRKIHKLLQPGGHVELTETPWQAVLHEISEETGYRLTQLRILQPTLRMTHMTNAALHPMPLAHNTHRYLPTMEHFHSDICYGFVTSEDPIDQPAAGESIDFHWLSAAQLQAIPAGDISQNSRELALFTVQEILGAWPAVALSEFSA